MADKRPKQSGVDRQDDNKVAMKKEMSLFFCITIIVGNVIGSGIFISPKGVLLHTKSVGMSLVVWAVSGVIVMLGGLSYAELGTTFGKSGGTYTYVREAFGPLLAFLLVWNYLLITLPVGCTILFISTARYIVQPIFPGCSPPEITYMAIAFICLGLIYFANCWKVIAATSVQNIFTVAKVTGLLIIIVTGIVKLTEGETQHLEDAFNMKPDSFMDVSVAFYQSMYAYSGWASLNTLTEELKNPVRDVPIAIVSSISIITVLYVLANIAYFTVLSPGELLASRAVGVKFADYAFGSYSWILPAFVAISIFGATHGSVLTFSRIFFASARDGHLPATIGMIHVDHRTPMPSLLLCAILTVIVMLVSDYLGTGIYKLLTYSTIALSLFSIISFAALIYMRFTRPDLKRPFKVPIVIPVIYLLITVYLFITAIIVSPTEFGIGIGIILTGVPLYYLGRWNKPAAFYKASDTVGNFIQKVLFVVSQEKKTY